MYVCHSFKCICNSIYLCISSRCLFSCLVSVSYWTVDFHLKFWTYFFLTEYDKVEVQSLFLPPCPVLTSGSTRVSSSAGICAPVQALLCKVHEQPPFDLGYPSLTFAPTLWGQILLLNTLTFWAQVRGGAFEEPQSRRCVHIIWLVERWRVGGVVTFQG